MVTPLTSVQDLQILFGTPPQDALQNQLLNKLLNQASAEITTWCNRADFGLALYTRMLSGNNTASLALPDWPVQEITLSGNTTAGVATIAGLPTTGTPSASNLFVNQSVFGNGIPSGTVITSIASASSGTVSISQAATANNTTASFQFGIALFVDNNGFAGSGPGAFTPATPLSQGGTLLQEGIDYYLDLDNGPGGPCSSGLVYRLGYYWFKPAAWIAGLVTPQTGPPIKNIQVQYLSGYPVIPPDVQDACEQLIARKRTVRKWGAGVESMSQGDMSVSLSGAGKVETGLFTPEIRSLLAPFRIEPTIGPA